MALLAAGLSACAPGRAPLPEPAPPPAPMAPAPDLAPPPSARPASVARAALRRDRAAAARDAHQRAEAARAQPGARNMAAYLSGAEAALLARGALRSDMGDLSGLTPERLTENFIQIALRDEYDRDGAALVSHTHPAPLRRWQDPVRFHIVFGDSVDGPARARDSAEIGAFAARLGRITGHPVSLRGRDGNVTVLILSEEERRALAPHLTEMVPGLPAEDAAAIRDLAPQNFCTIFAYSNGDSPIYVRAVALIRAELPPRLRSSCIHEELAQGMGLANDSPQARPSIFNDDEEFALLTRHDELLLKMLYDPRLRPGMTDDEVRPIALTIARELLGATP